jgi:hypothetical protein
MSVNKKATQNIWEQNFLQPEGEDDEIDFLEAAMSYTTQRRVVKCGLHMGHSSCTLGTMYS